MEFKSKLFAILAIFCVICSACAVSAADNVSDDGNGLYLDDSEDGHNGTIIPPDFNHNEAAQAAGGDMYDDGVPYHGDGTDPTATPTDNVTGANVTGNAAGANVTANGNSTNTTATHTMPATGNPIILLLGVGAIVGGYAVIRRK